MKYKFYSKKFKRYVTFSRPGDAYIYIDFRTGCGGICGDQICYNGGFTGNTVIYYGNDEHEFESICKRWWKQYLRLCRDN